MILVCMWETFICQENHEGVEEARLKEEEFEKEGRKLPPKRESQTFDSNAITPGTKFMVVLSIAL